MHSKRLFPTVFITLIAASTLTGCASLFQGDRFGDDGWDSTPTSQSAPAPDALDTSSDEYHRTQVSRAIQSQDIVPGMSPQEVIAAWGRPRDIQVAGYGDQGNERWLYYSGNSLRYGISRSRIIYFENGRVAGWESR